MNIRRVFVRALLAAVATAGITATTEVEDKCVTCHAKHMVRPGERPVRWDAKLA